jgi:hypothetical protein
MIPLVLKFSLPPICQSDESVVELSMCGREEIFRMHANIAKPLYPIRLAYQYTAGDTSRHDQDSRKGGVKVFMDERVVLNSARPESATWQFGRCWMPAVPSALRMLYLHRLPTYIRACVLSTTVRFVGCSILQSVCQSCQLLTTDPLDFTSPAVFPV